jgi:hypothetical protein
MMLLTIRRICAVLRLLMAEIFYNTGIQNVAFISRHHDNRPQNRWSISFKTLHQYAQKRVKYSKEQLKSVKQAGFIRVSAGLLGKQKAKTSMSLKLVRLHFKDHFWPSVVGLGQK